MTTRPNFKQLLVYYKQVLHSQIPFLLYNITTHLQFVLNKYSCKIHERVKKEKIGLQLYRLIIMKKYSFHPSFSKRKGFKISNIYLSKGRSNGKAEIIISGSGGEFQMELRITKDSIITPIPVERRKGSNTIVLDYIYVNRR